MADRLKKKKKRNQVPVGLATWEAEIRRIKVCHSLGDPILKMPKTKRDGGVAQVARGLCSKHKALSSNPNTAKKKSKSKEGGL
jgi:hypothetical protein